MRAQCLCGDVVWEAEGPLQMVHHCHCTRCQKTHGVAYSTFGAVPIEKFRWVQGREGIRKYKTSDTGTRDFCGRCGSNVPGEHPFQGLLFLPVGAFEAEDLGAGIDGHLFTASKQSWCELSDGLPTFEGWPPGVELESLPPLEHGAGKAPAGRARGSCLCGGIAWEVEGPPERMRHCHCQRCRRARGAVHATNALVARDKLHWTRGEGKAALFKLPEAARFSQAFCGDCGSPVPWFIEARGRYNVPAGAFDDDPGVRPSEHIFVGSKAAWFPITDAVPQHTEYPPD